MSNYYVSGCIADGDNVSICDDSAAQFWTLYHRNDDGLSEGIIDCVFREDAEAAMRVYEHRDALAAENANLLPKAASELSNAWVLHKYWVGIHAALMHMQVGRTYEVEQWLKGTIAGPGIGAPNLKLTEEIDAWANEQRKDSISYLRALEIIKAETPATDAYLNSVRAEVIPEGYVIVPQQMHLSADAMESLCFHCGDGGFAFGDFTDGLLWVGDIENDDGTKTYGLNIATAEYPEEGSANISEFAAKLRAGKDGE
ncbi:hypothetical protein [Pantoea agglomerans]|uniref:hypothetical protein n=1 Tax=Enterobacter agglomerans TaxID=549 RepID=UPI0010C16777|nr:hypothetical protein [Pantoea agglomerans]MBD8244379.1 hypothetical protein [Pantoea agglomerans]TKK33237.1 hypothetical protein PagCFBP13532_14550 [Pantoea agglomerans]